MRVTDTLNFNTFRVGSDAEFGVLSDTLLNDISDVLERGSQLFELIVAEGDVVGDVALVASRVEGLLELSLGIFIFFLFVKDATLGDRGLTGIGRHLGDQRLRMGHLFKFVLDVHLKLKNLVLILRVVNLLGDLGGFLVHASLEQALSVIQLVLDDVGVELGQLVVHVGGAGVVLNIEVAVCQQGKSGTVPRRELKLIGEDADDLHVLLVADQRVNRLSVLAIRHSPELLLHIHIALRFFKKFKF